MEYVRTPADPAVDESMSSSSEPLEIRLEGQEVSNRPALPYPVGFTGIHDGASPLLFPTESEAVLDLATQERANPVRLVSLGRSMILIRPGLLSSSSA